MNKHRPEAILNLTVDVARTQLPASVKTYDIPRNVLKLGKLAASLHANTDFHMAKSTPIRIGDKFKRDGRLWEVIETKPGGRIELFDRIRCIFLGAYHRQIKDWERA
jgi:hypothetical protein